MNHETETLKLVFFPFFIVLKKVEMLQEIEGFELLPNMASNAISNSHRTTEDSSTSLKKEIEDAFENNFNNQVRGKNLIGINTAANT